MSLDVSQNPKDKNTLILYEWNGGDNQKFMFVKLGGNRYTIYSAKTNQIVEVAGDDENNGARVVVGHQSKKASEYFDLIPANFHGLHNAFYIKTFACKAVDVAGGQGVNEAKITQWDYHGKDNQVWIIE